MFIGFTAKRTLLQEPHYVSFSVNNCTSIHSTCIFLFEPHITNKIVQYELCFYVSYFEEIPIPNRKLGATCLYFNYCKPLLEYESVGLHICCIGFISYILFRNRWRYLKQAFLIVGFCLIGISTFYIENIELK